MPTLVVMDSAKCNVIYIDHNVHQDRVYQLEGQEAPFEDLTESGELRDNLNLLLNAFGNVHVCTTGTACISKLFHLHDTSLVELKPTIVLIDTPYSQPTNSTRVTSRDPSPCSKGRSDSDGTESDSEEELYGLRLLERVVYETHSRNLSRLVVPIPVVRFPSLQTPPANDGPSEIRSEYLMETNQTPINSSLLRKCLDSGAVDVMASPLHIKTLTSLEVHAYRAHKKAAKEQQSYLEIRRGRKRSWVGVHEEKPFAYLREAMVSGLMSGICQPSTENDVQHLGRAKINVSSERRAEIANAVGQWHFCAHDFDDDSLLVAASMMFRHTLSMPELEPWRIPSDQMTAFLVACRAAYNTFVPYHNFRHAVDVLQATFNFLVHIGALPPYPSTSRTHTYPAVKSPLAALLQPFEALTLLISAIGHDVGHPGVNNGFLVTLNAPLAQLYNDRSVLESFHCAAYSQILRRHWPQAFEDTKMRSLMISSILATDMGLHFDYMKKLGDLQDKFKENPSTEGWSDRTRDEHTALACALLIKCADISNVARKHDAALKWMYILCDEFSRQASMESEIGIPSSLIAPPKKDFMSLSKAQMGFMNLFAIPLFQGVADVLPMMQYTVDELQINKALFEQAMADIPKMDEERQRQLTEGALSPRTMTLTLQPELDQMKSATGDSLANPVQDAPETHAEFKRPGTSPPDSSYCIPSMPSEYKEINGGSPRFESVADFAASDPFHSNEHDNRLIGYNGKQRCSETTEGSSSAPYSGDWHSQATSATTGKMPLSPSTKGTSIISQDSIERPASVPATTVTAPQSRLTTPNMNLESVTSEEDSNGSTLKPDISLKKKTSKFRMNALNLFRRNKGTSSPSSTGDSTS